MVDAAVVPVAPWHLEHVAENMREADRVEIAALSRWSPLEALRHSADASTWARTALVDGVPIQVFGVTPTTLTSRVGCPWLLGTDGIVEHGRLFLRHSREWRDYMLGTYPVLRNVVHDENDVAIRWLRWIGFTLSEPFETPGGATVRLFETRRSA